MNRAGALLPALCVAVALVGCGDDDPLGELPLIPVPGCEAHDPRPCDVRVMACQQRLFALAACLYGATNPGELPPATVVPEAEFAARLAADAENATPAAHLQEIEDGYALLGLVEHGDFSPQATAAANAKFIWGLYRSDSKDIEVIDHGEDFDRASASIVLVHEAVHALQDRAVDLQAFEVLHDDTEDAFRAAAAMIEGEARMHEDRYAASASGYDPAGIDFRQRTQNRIDRLLASLADARSPYTTVARQFPYLWGTRYMQLTAAAGGREAARGRFQLPPNSTRTLLASERAALAPEPPPVPAAAPSAPGDWTLIDATGLGAWGALLFLAHDTANLTEAALAAAQRLAGDGLWIYTTFGGGLAVVWRATFLDDDAALAATSVLAQKPRPPAVMRRGTEVIVAVTNLASASVQWAFSAAPAAYSPSSTAAGDTAGVINSGTRPERSAVRIGKAWPTRAPMVGSTASVL